MTIKEQMLKQKGMWLVITKDKSKYVIDLDNMIFDSYDWYIEGQLNSTLDDNSFNSIMKCMKSVKRMIDED